MKGLKRALRKRGVWLDAEQARVIAALVGRSHVQTAEELEIVCQFAARCRELE